MPTVGVNVINEFPPVGIFRESVQEPDFFVGGAVSGKCGEWHDELEAQPRPAADTGDCGLEEEPAGTGTAHFA